MLGRLLHLSLQNLGFEPRQNPFGNYDEHSDTGTGLFCEYCLFPVGITPPVLQYITLEIDSIIEWNTFFLSPSLPTLLHQILTISMEQSPWETKASRLVKKFSDFMELRGSLLLSQETANCPCPERDEFSFRQIILFLSNPSECYLPIYAYDF